MKHKVLALFFGLLVPVAVFAQSEALIKQQLTGRGMHSELAGYLAQVITPADIDASLIPGTDDTYDLGSASLRWQDLFLAGDLTLSKANKTIYSLDGISSVPADITAQVSLSQLSFIGLNTSTSGGALGVHTGSASTGGSVLALFKSRATDGTADTVVVNGDTIGQLSAYSADGTDFETAGRLAFVASAAQGNNDVPTDLVVSLSPDGSATLAEVARFTQAGSLTMAKAADVVHSVGLSTMALQEAVAGTACMGTATTNGTTAVTVSTTCATTGSRVFLTRTADATGTAANDQSGCWATNIVNGTSFDIDCSDSGDNGAMNWIIFHEAA